MQTIHSGKHEWRQTFLVKPVKISSVMKLAIWEDGATLREWALTLIE
jgi:hypothetical protein